MLRASRFWGLVIFASIVGATLGWLVACEVIKNDLTVFNTTTRNYISNLSQGKYIYDYKLTEPTGICDGNRYHLLSGGLSIYALAKDIFGVYTLSEYSPSDVDFSNITCDFASKSINGLYKQMLYILTNKEVKYELLNFSSKPVSGDRIEGSFEDLKAFPSLNSSYHFLKEEKESAHEVTATFPMQNKYFSTYASKRIAKYSVKPKNGQVAKTMLVLILTGLVLSVTSAGFIYQRSVVSKKMIEESA